MFRPTLSARRLLLGSLFGLLMGWSGGQLAASTLEGRSPFLPPDYKPPTTNTPAPSQEANQELELRGMYELNGEMRFLISDKRTREGRWVTVNDPDAPYAVRSFDASSQSVTLERNQRTEVLALVKPDPNAAPIPVMGAPAPYVAPPPMMRPPPMMPNQQAGTGQPGMMPDPRYMRRTIPPPPAIANMNNPGAPGLPPGVSMGGNANAAGPGANGPPLGFVPPPAPNMVPPPPPNFIPPPMPGATGN